LYDLAGGIGPRFAGATVIFSNLQQAFGGFLLRHPSLEGVEIRVVRDGGPRSEPYRPHVTMDLKVALILGGANRFQYRGSSWLAPRGTLIVAEPGEVHAAEPAAGTYDLALLYVDVERLAGLRQGERGFWRDGVTFKGPLSTDPRLSRAYSSMLAVLGDRTSLGLEAETRMHAFVDALTAAYVGRVPEAHRAPGDREGVKRAKDMLHDRFAEAVTLDTLAQTSGLPRPRFLRAFKREVGLAPHAYQVELRVDHARRLLAHGLPIADAAAAAGFFDQSHLHRHFTRVVAMTPRAYRNRRRS
jgi:AraC-like DNA-binding protein